MTIYSSYDQIQPGAFPAILAIGDSWFWYPKVSNLLSEISAIVKPEYSNIYTLGAVGKRLSDYLHGRDAANFATALRPADATYSAIMISGGGNDAVDWGLCLKDHCENENTAAGCIDQGALGSNMEDLSGYLLAMISEVHAAYDKARRTRADIFVHCYDYAPPNGIGFELPLFKVRLVGPWLKPAMDSRGVPGDYSLRKQIVRLLIDRLTETFAEFDSPGDGVYVIRSAGTLDQDTDWDNELHPNGRGFQKLVHGPWREVLKSSGYVR